MKRTRLALTALLLALPAVLFAQDAPLPRPEPTVDELMLHAPNACRHEVTRNMKRLALAIAGRYDTRRFVCPLGSGLSDPEPGQLSETILGVHHPSIARRGGHAIDILVSTARGGVQSYLTEDPPGPPRRPSTPS